MDAGDLLFSNELAGGDQADDGLLANCRDDGELGTTGLQVENAVGRSPCEKKACLALRRTR